MNVLIVGGGKAAATKLKRLEQTDHTITCIAPEFCEALKNSSATCVTGDFYMLSSNYFDDFDLIYLSLPLPESEGSLYYFKAQVECILRSNKLLSVSAQPEMGNFITPATRTSNNVTISVSTSGESPKRAVELAEKFSRELHP